MNKIENNIISEILLELSLAIGSEQNYDNLADRFISLWLRRLNCTIGAFIKKDNKQYSYNKIIPGFLNRNEIPPQIVEHIQKLSPTDLYVHTNFDEKHHYIYQLTDVKYYYFVRNEPISEENCNELYPITRFLAKSIDTAKAYEARLAAEKALKKERRLLRNVLNRLPDAIYLKNNKLEKILTNHTDLKNTGFENESDILGKKDSEIYPLEIAKEFEAAEKQILETGEPIIGLEELLENHKKENAWLLTSKFPFLDENGNIDGILGIGRNITEQKRVQEEIMKLSLVASQSTNGVIITDVEGYVEWINDGFTRMTGFSLDDMKGKKPGDLLQGPLSDQKTIDYMSRCIIEKRSFEVELVNYSKNGVPYDVKISCNPLTDEKGNITGFMAIESDISDSKKKEQELRKAKQEAEQAKEAEKAFLANMSHEIRTPLNAIIGMTSLLKETEIDNEQKEYIGHLDQSSRFLLRLISDILDLSKIEAGKIQKQSKIFNLHRLLKNLISNFDVKANEKRLNLELEIEKELFENIESDEVLIQQVVNNLISNAIKFTDRGFVKLKASGYKDKTTDVLKVIVQDSGKGISKEDQGKLFTKFNQVGDQKSINTGTGLGLCITKEIIELLDGQIEVTSQIGEGSTFEFKIPVKIVTEQIKDDQTNTTSLLDAAALKERKILIAEDNLLNQKYITRLFDKLNIAYDLVENGQEAVNKALEVKYAVILMDIQMPVMNGFDATVELRNTDNINQNTPIIALTASAFIEDRDKAFKLGFTDYLSKPFTPKQLKEKLRILQFD